MNEVPSNPFQASAPPLSPDTRQLVEDFIERMEAIQAEQAQALIIAASEAAVKRAEASQLRQHRLRGVFSPRIGGIFFRRRPRSQQPQPPASEEDTPIIIDAPYRVLDGKE